MRRALISVSDKTDIVEFAKELVQHEYEIISTGGTKQKLEEANIPVQAVEDIIDTKEMLDGRVKTLHPVIHAGLLAVRDKPNHMNQLQERNISPIDLVCVNLYPFEDTIKKDGIKEDEAIEQIDIGGPSMLRSAAKNFKFVTVVSDISQYNQVLSEFKEHGNTTLMTRKKLAKAVFKKTAQYDGSIAEYFEDQSFPKQKNVSLEYHQSLRYGENPHQKAAVYKTNNSKTSLLAAKQLHGKELSYNNIQDANAALQIIRDYNEPTAVGLKHMNPCGIASASTIEKAFKKAYECDSISIFGGIVALNRNVTKQLASLLHSIFLEIIIAPSFTKEALEILMKKKNIRILTLDTTLPQSSSLQYTTIDGGMLIQEQDKLVIDQTKWNTPTKKKPTQKELDQALFAWNAVKHVKSNAIVVTKDTQTVGIGAGQMNRVGAAKIALEWAKEHNHTSNLILASDAFFPFDDVVRLAHEHGVTLIIQPGGSIRDQQSIDACNELGIAMIFTTNRHFKH